MSDAIKLTRAAVKFEIYGKEHTLRKPTWLELEDLQESTAAPGESAKKKLQQTREFVVSLGLPDEVAKSLDYDHMQTIIDAVTPKKKA